MAAAMALRMSFWRSGAPAGGAGVTRAAAAASMSAKVTAPCGPLPLRVSGSRPSAFARFRAAGDTGCRAVMVVCGASCNCGVAGCGTVAGAAIGPAAGGWAPAGAATSPGASSLAKTVPTGTFSPACTSSSVTTPSCQISTSTAALEVSTTATTWPRLTASPGFTCQVSSVPSSMSAPSEGSLKSIMGCSRTRRVRRPRSSAPAAGRPLPCGGRTESALPRCTHAPAGRRGQKRPAP